MSEEESPRDGPGTFYNGLENVPEKKNHFSGSVGSQSDYVDSSEDLLCTWEGIMKTLENVPLSSKQPLDLQGLGPAHGSPQRVLGLF